MDFEVSRTIDATHPSLPGHFPGSPIVPGVVILDEIVAALSARRPNITVNSIPLVKFVAPLKPDQSFLIRFSNVDGDEIAFRCQVGNELIVDGRLWVGCQTS